MRKTSAVLALALVATASTACGGSDSGSSSSAQPPAPLTKPDAERIAKASLLTAADLPGYKETPATPPTAEEKATGDKVNKCVGLEADATRVLATAESPDFAKGAEGAQSISSSVDVVKDAATAKGDLEKIKDPKAATCFEDELRAVFSGKQFQGATVSDISVQQAQVQPPAGADGASGFTFAATVAVGPQKVKISGQASNAVVGAAELSVQAIGIGGQVPTAELDKAFAAVVQHAQQAQQK